MKIETKVELTDADVLQLMHDSFCGGLQDLYYCDCFIDWDNKTNNDNYDKAKALLLKEGAKQGSLCSEDVMIKMLTEFGIVFKDYCEGDENNNIVLTFDMAKANIIKAIEDTDNGVWFTGEVNKIIPEYNDADGWTYFHVLQGALFGSVIYG